MNENKLQLKQNMYIYAGEGCSHGNIKSYGNKGKCLYTEILKLCTSFGIFSEKKQQQLGFQFPMLFSKYILHVTVYSTSNSSKKKKKKRKEEAQNSQEAFSPLSSVIQTPPTVTVIQS